MAEVKKEAPKKETSKSETNWVMFIPIWIIAFIILLGALTTGQSIFSSQSSQNGINATRSFFDIYRLIGTGEISEGVRIINTAKVLVRNQPAGGILGDQKKLNVGIVREGPVSAYNVNWFRVDYEDAPDGWVVENVISSKVSAVRTFNIIPILYGLYKPIGYGLLIILGLFFVYFKIQLKREEKIGEKKLELRLENAKEKPLSTTITIEQKPDVQELPGFQTEEIMPIEELEKQGRWQHIQDLIKSYNQNDWRQAIIEADIILEEMLDKMQYEGVTIGDKLKNVERSDFITLEKAWSAHKVRNQIAHDGSDFKLTREVAEKTIKDFEEVFREFYYI
ncbi:MAG: hypothetical protein RLY49_397 [Candidatus Parcubacteria bacterium]|jgi:hypothetical protein